MEGPFSWGCPGPEPSLNLLNDNLLMDALDDRTLQCLIGGPSTSALAGSLGAQGSEAGHSNKRPCLDFESLGWLDEGHCEADEAACGEGGCGGGEGDDSGGEDRKGKRLGRKGKPMSQQALVKATREKARRERLNDCFDELARLCDPSGKVTKTDRVSIVADAIRVLGQMRVENNQLRQLNKFLEERVSTYERERAQARYQQLMMQQLQQQAAAQQVAAVQAQQAAAGMQLAAAPSCKIQPAVPTLPTAQPPMGLPAVTSQQALDLASAVPMPAPAAAAASAQPADPAAVAAHATQQAAAQAQAQAAATAAPTVSGAVTMQPSLSAQQAAAAAMGSTVALVQFGHGGMGAQLVGIKQEQLTGLATGFGGQPTMLLSMGVPSVLPPGAPSVSWLPATSLDVQQDQKLRPPAA